MAFKIASFFLIWSLALLVQSRVEGQKSETVKVSKCCEVNSILVEEHLGEEFEIHA